MSHAPTSELVAVAWLKGVAGLPVDSIATTLPGPDQQTNNVSWAASGFVQVGPVVGGSPHSDVPVRQPVLSVNCWAVNLGGKKPPWNRANALAEAITNAVYALTADPAPYHRAVTLPTGYRGALVLGASVLTEPRRRPAEPANYARYGLELQLSWVALP